MRQQGKHRTNGADHKALMTSGNLIFTVSGLRDEALGRLPGTSLVLSEISGTWSPSPRLRGARLGKPGGRGHWLVGTLGGREARGQCWGQGRESRKPRHKLGGGRRSWQISSPRWRSHSPPQRAPVAAETRRPSWQREAESV